MLAWRAISRPTTILRSGLQIPRRSLRVSTPLTQVYQPRGPGVLAKIRFRPDGKPRSRMVGLAFGTLLLFNVFTLFMTYDIVEDSEIALGLLASIIYLQHLDKEYQTVDFEDLGATYAYFKKLYQSFSRIPMEQVDELFDGMTRLLKLGGEGEPQVEAHRIMRHAAEQIHNAFVELDQDSIANTANFMLLVMQDALDGLIDLVQNVDDDSDSKYTFQLIRDHSKKDPGAVLKDYESLG
ncbi:hypothetical protein CPB84DRAFT_1729146 [Gymnopilus junonius]|uniref:Uncharacterized protein n=1 Tax=Gymnopilus junonius TaxID=109634 RepID=A0A9P5TPQ8_GYMJU|nr:hypothetical protein CPB84DRAFT_1729146 [Gymnopilus junonius]